MVLVGFSVVSWLIGWFGWEAVNIALCRFLHYMTIVCLSVFVWRQYITSEGSVIFICFIYRLTLKALKYFYINHGEQRVLFNLKSS